MQENDLLISITADLGIIDSIPPHLGEAMSINILP